MTATRLYFKATKNAVFEQEVKFEFAPGFAPSQKEKNRISMHEAILKIEPNAWILEVSTKSDHKFGKALSAFNLKIDNRPFECIFQEAKRFEIKGEANTDIELSEKGKNKRRIDICERLVYDNELCYIEPKSDNPRELRAILKAFMEANKNKIKLAHFHYKGEKFELNAGFKNSASFFYDFLYFRALSENFSQNELKNLLKFSIFTDIEFNHQKSINCQARSCAFYHFALLNDKAEFYLKNKDNFKSLYKDAFEMKTQNSPKNSLFDSL